MEKEFEKALRKMFKKEFKGTREKFEKMIYDNCQISEKLDTVYINPMFLYMNTYAEFVAVYSEKDQVGFYN